MSAKKGTFNGDVIEHSPLQPVAPLFVHPLAQLPHVRPPGVLEQVRAL